MSVQLQFIGCGDAFGSGGRFQTCFVIDDSQGRIGIDFGASSLIALKSHNIEPAGLDMVIISHLHGDHFAGLPFLLLDLHLRAKSGRPLTLAGPPGFAESLENLCNVMYPNIWETQWHFPLNVVEIKPGIDTELFGRTFTTREVLHSPHNSPATAIRVACDDKVIAYSGDTGWTDALVEVADGTDLFICECNFFTMNPSIHHLSYAALLENVSRLRTKRLILTHLSDEALEHEEKMDIEVAADGKVVSL